MKKLVLIIAVAMTSVMSYGQSMFDQFEDMDGVTSMVVNNKMFSMLANIEINTDDAEAQQFVDMIKKITSLKVLTTGDEGISGQMMSKVTSYLKSSNLDELMRIKDGGQTVKIYVKEGKDEYHVKELLMFVNGLKEMTAGEDITINGKKRDIETVILSLTGDIDLRQISKLTDKMDMPGGKHLKKAGEKQKTKQLELIIMNISSIKNIVMSLFIVVALTSCNYGETLQSYYVANQETPNFISVDIPVSFVSIDNIELTDDQKDAYESMDKLNMLGYTLTDDNVEEYKTEIAKVQLLLKNEKYQELFRGGNSSDGKVIIKYIGDDDSIDELIIFGNANDRGFAIIRVLGNNMEPAKIMQLGDVVSQMSSDETSVTDFMKFFQ